MSILFDNDEDDEMLDFTASADFRESSTPLAEYLQNNPNTISYIEKELGIKFDRSFEDPEEIFLTVTDGPVGEPSDAPELLIQILDSFVYNLNNIGFKCVSKTNMVTEYFPDEVENTTPKEFLN
jgi:hypothetical protein